MLGSDPRISRDVQRAVMQVSFLKRLLVGVLLGVKVLGLEHLVLTTGTRTRQYPKGIDTILHWAMAKSINQSLSR